MLDDDSMEISDVLAGCEELKGRLNAKFIAPNLNAISKNGYAKERLKPVFDATNIHPAFTFRDGRIALTLPRLGSGKSVWRKFIRSIVSSGNVDPSLLFIVHAGFGVREQEYIKKLIDRYSNFDKVIFNRASMSSCVSLGEGFIGVSLIRRHPGIFADEGEDITPSSH